MEVIRKPEIRMYWNTSEMLETPYFLHSQIMSRDRYLKISKCLRFGKPIAAPTKKSRVSEFMQIIRTICQFVHEPSQY